MCRQTSSRECANRAADVACFAAPAGQIGSGHQRCPVGPAEDLRASRDDLLEPSHGRLSVTGLPSKRGEVGPVDEIVETILTSSAGAVGDDALQLVCRQPGMTCRSQPPRVPRTGEQGVRMVGAELVRGGCCELLEVLG